MRRSCHPSRRRTHLRGPAAALLLGAAAAVPGCHSGPTYLEADSLYFAGRPRDLLARYAPAEHDRQADALVGIDKMLSAAILDFDWKEAERLAELASLRVNIHLAGERGERDALSFLGRERSKPFKGEPHERAMVDFYLGLLRYRRGEHEGALNAFLSAMAKDRGLYRLPAGEARPGPGAAEGETVLYSADYATFAFFASSACLHIDEPEEAARHLEEARRLRPDLVPLFEEALDPRNNVLVVIESGRAPRKQKLGRRGEVLGYERGQGAAVEGVRIGGRPVSLAQTDDLYYQATTLGGRGVDELNRLKAVRQEALHTAGVAAAAAGGYIAMVGGRHRDREMQAAGLIGLGVGIATVIFSETAVDPSADVRAWNTLPGTLHLAVGRAEPGATEVEIAGRGFEGSDQSQRWTGVPISASGTTLLWFRLLPHPRSGAYPSGEGGVSVASMNIVSRKDP